jgi:NAD(P)-dependent dehydrogenase (short-subunit alcohol dehydrogenase family)
MARHGGGRIVFISSTGAAAAHANTSVYDAMKAGLEGLTRCLAVELGPSGILVNAIEPGHILNGTNVPSDPTPARLAHWRAIPMGRAGLPEEVAQAALFLASPQTTYLTGTVLRVDGGRTARSPIVVAPVT